WLMARDVRSTLRVMSPDSRFLALIFNPPGNSLTPVQRFGLFEMSTGRTLCEQVLEHGAYLPRFSPDSKHVALELPNSEIRVWEVASGREIAHFRNPDRNSMHLSFLPDGETLAAVQSKAVRLWDLRTGMLRAQLVGDSAQFQRCQATPDSRTLVLICSPPS